MAKVKMTLVEAVSAHGALNSFSNSARLGWDLSWEIDDLIESLEKHQKRFQDEGEKIMAAYGEPVEGQPGRFNINPDQHDEYKEATEKLGDTEITVTFEPLDFQKLEKSGVKVQGREMRALRKHFIKRNKPEADPETKKKAKEHVDSKLEAAK